MSSRIVLRALFEDFSPEEYGAFVPLHPGVEILPLYGISAEGKPLSSSEPSAAILRYAPGAKVPQHLHAGMEHIIILSGSQTDPHGTYVRGTCVFNPPGTLHSVSSEEGCLVLAIWDRPVELIQKSSADS